MTHLTPEERDRTPERFAQKLEDLRLTLSKIEKRDRFDSKFIKSLLAQKKYGTLRLTGNSAYRIDQLHRKYVVAASSGPPTAA